MAKNKLQTLKGRIGSPKASASRPVGTRHKKVRFLIVCEGEKTELNERDIYQEMRTHKTYESVIVVMTMPSISHAQLSTYL